MVFLVECALRRERLEIKNMQNTARN